MLTPRLLQHVAAPLLRFEPVDGAFPERYAEAGRYPVRMKAFGILPLGRQVIAVTTDLSDAARGVRRVRDAGSGDLAKVWDHRITVAGDGAGGTRYTDEVRVEAGLLTPGVCLFAWLFYAWRQHRWRALVARQFRF